MQSVYIVGGQQRGPRSMLEGDESWYRYRKGLVLRVDLDEDRVEQCVEYISPADVCANEDPAILFKSATLEDNRLYACTQTEVLVYRLPEFSVDHYISLPCFNDVHHVRPTHDGTLLVAISGLDMVAEVTLCGDVLREWNTLGEDPWQRFSRDVDYRRVASLKPHRSHPNQVFFIGDEIWATRFEQRDAICLTNPERRIDIGIERVHDGVVDDGKVYFTTVNGHVVIVDATTLETLDVIDLNEMSMPNALLGWCRGIMIDDQRIWVGFSRLRLTKLRENLSWVRKGFKHHLPTSITCYDLEERACIKEVDLQARGLDAVFSIFPASITSIDAA
jgi:hypothetical protein